MRYARIAAAAACTVLAGAGVASAQTVVIQYEAQPCVLTLNSSYTGDGFGSIDVEIPNSAVSCPDFTFDPAFDPMINGTLTNASSQVGPQFGAVTLQYFDAATNAIMQKNVLQLSGQIGSFQIPATYDRFTSNMTVASIQDHNTEKRYRLVLAAPVTISSSAPATPSCRIKLKRTYAWRWNQARYWVVPDSAVQCTGVTFSSSTMSAYIPFQSRQLNQGYLTTGSKSVYNPATGQYTASRQLRFSNYGLSSYDELLNLQFSGFFVYSVASREHGAPLPSGSGGASAPTWGRFSLQKTSDFVPPLMVQQAYFPPANTVSPRRQFLRLISTGPVTVKRATDVTLKAKRVGDGQLRLSITADRNWSFRNTVAETYRRQTVLPATPADHAVLRRGSTVLKKVKLSVYGTATLTVTDTPGRTKYSVTMVETDDNFQGKATITR